MVGEYCLPNVDCFIGKILEASTYKNVAVENGVLAFLDRTAGDKNISILHLSCRTSDLQFSVVLQHIHLSFKSVCNREHKGLI